MPSIRSLMDTFGPPPSEVRLDWAWQIADVIHDDSRPLEREAADLLANHDDWTVLEVASDGRLQLEGIDRAMAARALDDLLTWTRNERCSTERATPHEQHCDSTHQPMTLVAHSMTESALLPDAFAATDRLQNGPSSTVQRKRPKRSSKSPSLTSTLSACMHDRRVRKTSLRTVAVVTGLLLLAWATVALQHKLSPEGENVAVALEPPTKLDARATDEAHDRQPGALRSGDDTDDPLDRIASADDAMVGPLMNSTELVGLMPDEVSESPNSAMSASPLGALKLAERLTAPTILEPTQFTKGQATEEQTDSQKRQAELPRDREGAVQGQAVGTAHVQDVMQQVAQAVAQAASQAEEDVLAHHADNPQQPGAPPNQPVSAASTDWSHQPVIAFARERMRLRCEFPRGVRERLREPYWSIVVEHSEGFAHEPGTVAGLAPRSGTTMRIYDDEAKSPRACIIVQLTNRGGRDAALDWHISGGADDMPALRLPLARKWLDPLQAQLKFTVAALRGLTELPLPSASGELRTALLSQRRLASDQLKIGQRLLTITADLDRLAALVDGEVQYHVQLSDGADGPAVLRYGDPIDR